MTQTPTNCTVSVKRNGADVEGMTQLPALLLPARPEIVAMQGIPAGKAYEFMFTQLVPNLRDDDELVRDNSDPTFSVRVSGVMHVDSPHGAHTEGTATAKFGT